MYPKWPLIVVMAIDGGNIPGRGEGALIGCLAYMFRERGVAPKTHGRNGRQFAWRERCLSPNFTIHEPSAVQTNSMLLNTVLRNILDPIYVNHESAMRRAGWFDNLEDAVNDAQARRRPIMVIVYLPQCQSCAVIIPKILQSGDIASWSDAFTMAIIQDDQSTPGMRRDGIYTPRIFFLRPTGQVEERFYNKLGNPRYKYFYPNPESLMRTMVEVNQYYYPV